MRSSIFLPLSRVDEIEGSMNKNCAKDTIGRLSKNEVGVLRMVDHVDEKTKGIHSFLCLQDERKAIAFLSLLSGDLSVESRSVRFLRGTHWPSATELSLC